jgi:hypothetical protein
VQKLLAPQTDRGHNNPDTGRIDCWTGLRDTPGASRFELWSSSPDLNGTFLFMREPGKVDTRKERGVRPMKEKLDEHINVRITPSMKEALREKADELNIPERTVVRLIMASALRGDSTPDWFKDVMQSLSRNPGGQG